MNDFQDFLRGASSPAVEAIDATLDARSKQLANPALNPMHDPAEARRRLSSEALDVSLAIYSDDSVETVETEIADLVYSALVAARSHGKPARLGNVLGILAARNQSGVTPSGPGNAGTHRCVT